MEGHVAISIGFLSKLLIKPGFLVGLLYFLQFKGRLDQENCGATRSLQGTLLSILFAVIVG
ncbi:hypothetical protein C7B76_08715 [filamentous cyanobacterium CCP2]|nr:hypothetical protein C7B76_08715 [filamentous cyanobacterium CCP2]